MEVRGTAPATVFLLGIFALIILTIGTPDLLDAIIANLMQACPQ